MATKKNLVEEAPLVYGDGNEEELNPQNPEQNPGEQQEEPQDPPADSSTGSDTPADPSTGGDTPAQEETEEMTLQESIQAQLKRGSEIVDMGPNYKTTYAGTVKDASRGAGAAQASNMQTATTVGARIPQVDTTEYAVRSRFAANGKNAGKDSEFAIKATSEGAGFKPTKDVKKNSFPEDGSTYLEVVNTNSY